MNVRWMKNTRSVGFEMLKGNETKLRAATEEFCFAEDSDAIN
jgi:hypothetical protein